MKKIVFTIGGKRLEVDLEDEFANYLSNDLLSNKVLLNKDNEVSKLLQLYLKSLHKEHNLEKQIKILINKLEI